MFRFSILSPLLLIILLTPHAYPVEQHVDIYSESVVSGREEALSFSFRARNDVLAAQSRWVEPYAQLGTELATPGLGATNISPASYAYAGAGGKVSIGTLLALRAEGRVRGQLANANGGSFNPWDGRLLLTYGDFYQTALSVGPWLAFAEPYSETLYSTVDTRNITHSDYLRLGVRYVMADNAFLDLLAEPFLSVDRVGHYYNNRADIKIGPRVTYAWQGVAIALHANAIANYYFPVAEQALNPFLGRTLSYRLLLVVGAYL